MKSYLKLWTFILCLFCAITAEANIIDTICASSQGEVYRVKPTQGSKYFWFVECGTIVSSAMADSVVVNWCSTPGLYTIKVIEINAFGCIGDTMMAQILIKDKILVEIDGPTEICEGETIMLQAKGASNYKWSTGETTPVIFVSPKKNTKYTVRTTDGTCYSDSAAHTVLVFPKPQAGFSVPNRAYVENIIRFNNQSKGADDFEWVFIEDLQTRNSKEKNPEIIFNEPGEKQVTLVVKNKSGCSDTVTYHINIQLESKIFIPTAFTPDRDGVNDGFKPATSGIETIHVDIFNRWGEKLYEITDLDGSWDGTFRGQLVQQDVYLYIVRAQGFDKQWHYLKGNVTIIY